MRFFLTILKWYTKKARQSRMACVTTSVILRDINVTVTREISWQVTRNDKTLVGGARWLFLPSPWTRTFTSLKGASLYSVIHHPHEPWTGFRQWPTVTPLDSTRICELIYNATITFICESSLSDTHMWYSDIQSCNSFCFFFLVRVRFDVLWLRKTPPQRPLGSN